MQAGLFAHELVCPMTLQVQRLNATTARLTWDPVTGATQYSLYRGTTPYFSPGGLPWRTVAAPATHTDFTDGIGDVSTNYFFIGKAGSAASVSSSSNTVGEFDLDTGN